MARVIVKAWIHRTTIEGRVLYALADDFSVWRQDVKTRFDTQLRKHVTVYTKWMPVESGQTISGTIDPTTMHRHTQSHDGFGMPEDFEVPELPVA